MTPVIPILLGGSWSKFTCVKCEARGRDVWWTDIGYQCGKCYAPDACQCGSGMPKSHANHAPTCPWRFWKS